MQSYFDDANLIEAAKPARKNGISPVHYLFIAFALVVFATSYSLIVVAMRQVPPVTVAAVRFSLCAAFVLPFAIRRYGFKFLSNRTRKDWIDILAIASLMVFIPNLFQNIGLLYTSAAVTSVIQSTAPIFAAALAFVFIKERIGWNRWLGGAISLAGVILLSTGGKLTGFAGSSAFGNLLQVVGTISLAGAGIVLKSALKKFSPLFLITTSFLFGALLLVLSSFLIERAYWPAITSLSEDTIVSLLLLSVLLSIGLFGWYSVLQRVPVSALFYSLFTLPVLGIVSAVLLVGESFGLAEIIFSAVILAGLGIAEVPLKRNLRQ